MYLNLSDAFKRNVPAVVSRGWLLFINWTGQFVPGNP